VIKALKEIAMEHPEFYSLDESRRRAALLVRGGWRVLRGKSTARIDRDLERLAAEAVERETKARRTNH
jgi:hypothetical protein